MGVEELKGFQLEVVHFGISFYNLVFNGEQHGNVTTLHVGTNYYISKSVDNLEDLGGKLPSTVFICLITGARAFAVWSSPGQFSCCFSQSWVMFNFK